METGRCARAHCSALRGAGAGRKKARGATAGPSVAGFLAETYFFGVTFLSALPVRVAMEAGETPTGTSLEYLFTKIC